MARTLSRVTRPVVTAGARPGWNGARLRSAPIFPLCVGVAFGMLIAALAISHGAGTRSATDLESGRGPGFGVQSETDDESSADHEQASAEGFSHDAVDDETDAGQRTGSTVEASDHGSSDPAASGPGDVRRSGEQPGRGQVRGVTADKIRIGVAIPDIGPFAVVDEFNLGDVREHMEAILDRWRREGLVPVHGRDVEFVYRVFSITVTKTSRPAAPS